MPTVHAGPGGPEAWRVSVGPNLPAFAAAAGSAVVTLLVTDGWQQMKDGLLAVWQCFHPEAADEVDQALETSRQVLLPAARALCLGDADSVSGYFVDARRPARGGRAFNLVASSLGPEGFQEPRGRARGSSQIAVRVPQ